MQHLKYKLRTATPQDVPFLRENWRLSFGDTDEYLDFFFSRRFVPDNSLVAEKDGKVVSQLFLLPTDVISSEGVLSADYLYAAATHPQYRRKGIMGALMKKAFVTRLTGGKDAIVLMPGTPSLYDFYKKFGYKPDFTRRRLHVTREELLRLSVQTKHADAETFIGLYVSQHDGIWWDNYAIRYALEEQRLFRGPYAASEHAFVSICDGEATCLCEAEHFGECASLLLEISDLTEFSLVFPPNLPFGTLEEGGMIFRIHRRDAKLRDAFFSFAME